MKNIVTEPQNRPDEGRDDVNATVSRLKKYIYVLPSGRKLKVIEYDESTLARSAA
jgi:hypothetical protein